MGGKVTSRHRQWQAATALSLSLTLASLGGPLGIALLGSALPAAAQGAAAKGEKPVVTLTTSLGAIELELDAAKAPITVKNFLEYVDAGFFDGTIFHRVIPGFMVQGGGFGADFVQKPTRGQIKNEAHNGLVNARGTVAMARTNVVDSATAEVRGRVSLLVPADPDKLADALPELVQKVVARLNEVR